MEELVKLFVDNGISVVICAAFLYYIFKQQEQNNKVVESFNKMNETMNEMYKNLALINEKLGIKLTKSKKEGE